MAVATLKQLWKNEYFKTAIMIVLTILIVLGFWYGFELVQNTQYPAMAVATGSMCTLPGPYCDGWTHPFERTLHVGDLIIVQGIKPEEIKTNSYPEGDILVFHKPKPGPDYPDELIVHRAIAKTTRENGLIYFKTKGDGNPGDGDHWLDYRGENYAWNGMISENMVVGKVVLRFPWVGHLSLFMRNSYGIFVIVTLIIIIVIVEFVIPAFTSKEAKTESKESVEKAFEA